MPRAAALLSLIAACHRAPPPAAPPAAPPVAAVAADAAPPLAPSDRDGDGVADDVDRCPDQAMVMGPACPPEPSGCPDDCRPPTPLPP